MRISERDAAHRCFTFDEMHDRRLRSFEGRTPGTVEPHTWQWKLKIRFRIWRMNGRFNFMRDSISNPLAAAVNRVHFHKIAMQKSVDGRNWTKSYDYLWQRKKIIARNINDKFSLANSVYFLFIAFIELILRPLSFQLRLLALKNVRL